MKQLDDYQVGAKAQFGATRVTREEVIDFASRFDPQPAHLDDMAAAANPIFGRLAASGWHTAAMATRMMADHAKATEAGKLGSPAITELHWTAPVYPGDTLRVESEIIDTSVATTRPNIGLVKSNIAVFNQHDEVVMTMITTEMVPTQAL